MIKKRNFLITKNEDEDIINIDNITSIESDGDDGTYIYSNREGRNCHVRKKRPEEILKVILGGIR